MQGSRLPVLSHLPLTKELYEGSTIIIPILEQRKLRLREGGGAEKPPRFSVLLTHASHQDIMLFINYKDLRKHK